MNPVPDLERLLDLARTLDRGLLDQLPRDALLRQALPVAAACLPGARALRVYRVHDDVAVLEAATDWPDSARVPLAGTALGAALDSDGPLFAAQDSAWVVPLTASGVLYGLLEIADADADVGAERAALVALHLAGALHQAALVDINARLSKTASIHSEQLARVTGYGQRIQASLDTAAVLEATLEAISEVVLTDRIEIALFDAADGKLRTVALYTGGERFITLRGGSVVSLEGTLAGRVWNARAGRYIPDAQAAPELATGGLQGLRTLLALPVFSRVGVLAVVTLGSAQPDAYAPADIALLEQMLGLLANALENAIVYDRSQHAARNEALINVISERLQQQMDVQSMFDVALTELGRAIGAQRAQVRLRPPANQ
ncbi:MAG: GAF domain-containing protein [Aggregatilineales bacterium]